MAAHNEVLRSLLEFTNELPRDKVPSGERVVDQALVMQIELRLDRLSGRQEPAGVAHAHGARQRRPWIGVAVRHATTTNEGFEIQTWTSMRPPMTEIVSVKSQVTPLNASAAKWCPVPAVMTVRHSVSFT